jgi:response regulator RpfG family c-di-GMP phosphodiesterase
MTELNPLPAPATARLPTILCVDDEPNILSSLKRLFRAKGFQVRLAESGAAGLALLESEPVDLVISDMRMPEMDGTQFLAQVRVRWPDTVRLLLTGYSDINSIIDAINRGEIFRYIAKPWDDNDIVLIVRQALERKELEQEKKRLEALTFQQNEALKALNASLEARVQERTHELSVANDKLKANYVTTLKVFSTLIDMRGGNLAGHARRVADMARRIALKLELDSKLVQEIFVAGLLHEIGKVGFADELLGMPVGMMKPPQLDIYRKHTVLAEQLLLPLPDLKDVSDLISGQFERFDGTGFPAQLAAEAIPIGTRILTLASDYDNMRIGALTHNKLTSEEAKIIITHSSGKRYDPQVVAAFMDLTGGAQREEAERAKVRERAVTSGEMLAGMVLSRDLITTSGLLMLSIDHMLDERLIQKIRDFEKTGNMKLTAWIRAE